MINEERWINSIAKVNTRFREGMNQLDHNRWVNTIHKKNTYDSFNSFKKYSLMGILFVSATKPRFLILANSSALNFPSTVKRKIFPLR